MSNRLLDRDDLEKLYKEEFEPMLPEIQKSWSEAYPRFKKNRNIIIIIGLGITFILIYYQFLREPPFIPHDDDFNGNGLVFGMFFFIWTWQFFIISGLWRDYQIKLDVLFWPLRQKTITACLNSIGENLIYTRWGKEEKDFKDDISFIFPGFNDYRSLDRVVGEFDGKRFEFFELRLVDLGDESEPSKTIFNGYIIVVDVSRYNEAEIAFIPNNTKPSMRVKNKYLFSRKSKVNLESLDFEKVFDVYSTDQVMARKFFTPAFMENFVEYSKQTKENSFNRKEGVGIYGYLNKGKLILAVSSVRDRFELDTVEERILFRKFFVQAIKEIKPIVRTVALLENK